MKMQRIISFLLCVALVCTLFGASQISAYAEESAVVKARSSVVRVITVVQVTYGHEMVPISGTGFLVSENGKDPRYVVTNKHVVDSEEILEGLRQEITRYAQTGLEDIFVWVLIDDKAYEIDYTKDVTLSKNSDLALIKLDKPVSGRKAAVLGNASKVQVTDTIYAIGYPGIADVEDYESIASSSLEDDLIREYPSKVDNLSVTKGSVSKSGVISGGVSHIQHDASISGGSSGGPLVNENGEIIGVNTWSSSSTVGAAYYAISVDNVKTFLKQNDIAYIDAADIKPVSTPTPTPIPDELPTFKMQPDNTTVNEGNKVTLKVEVSGKNLSYQWQRREPGSQEWKDITSEEYPGAKTAKLTIPETEKSGTQFRCAVKNGAGTVYSNSVTLTVNLKPVIAEQPVSMALEEGETAKFSVAANGDGLSYQWQISEDGGKSWENISLEDVTGAESAELAVPAALERNGLQFRCEIKNDVATVYSDIASIEVSAVPTPAPEVTEEPTQTSVFQNKALIIGIAVAAVLVVCLAILLTRKKKPKAEPDVIQKTTPVLRQDKKPTPIVRSLAPQHSKKKIALGGDTILLGRGADCKIIFAEETPGVSTRHCSIAWDSDTLSFKVRDLGSTYGTFLETGMKLETNKEYRLKPGDSFYLGDKENLIKLELE